MAKYQEPDRLSLESSMAIAAGMSYGKWKAMQTATDMHAYKMPADQIPNVRTRACQNCGILFSLTRQGSGVKKFCSDDCREHYNQRRYEQMRKEMREDKHKICPACGKEFVTKANNQKYCDKQCYMMAAAERKKKRYQNKTCQVCGKEFATIANNQKYCSVGCSRVASSENRKKRHQMQKEGLNNGDNQML